MTRPSPEVHDAPSRSDESVPLHGFKTETADLGLPPVNLDCALALEGDLDDEERVRSTAEDL